MKKAGILLSTYNGERFLGELLDSLLAQTYPDVTVFVWDDGSTDRTPEILREYEKKGIQVVNYDKHVGYPLGFYELFKRCGGLDYYFLCDQDDVWKPKKVEWAIKKLEKLPQETPNLYYSAYDICNMDLSFIKPSPPEKTQLDFRGTLFECRPLGFNMAYNQKAFDMMAAHLPMKETCKDIWIQMICAAFGTVVHDRKSTTYYRRNDGAITDGNKNWLSLFLWRMKKFFLDDGFAGLRKILQEFEEVYATQLKEEDAKMLRFFNGKNPLGKMCYPHRLRSRWMDEISLRVIFLLGKL